MSNSTSPSIRIAAASPSPLPDQLADAASTNFALEAAVEHGLRVQAQLQARLNRDEVERRNSELAARAATVRHLEQALADLESRLAEQSRLLESERNGAAGLAQERSQLAAEVGVCRARIESLQQELIVTNSGAAAALTRRLRAVRTRLAPTGTTRDRATRLFIKGLRSLAGQGPLTTARKSVAWTRRKLSSGSAPRATPAIHAIPAPAAAPEAPVSVAPVPSQPPQPACDIYTAPFCHPAAVHADYADWIAENEPTLAELEHQKTAALAMGYRPLISILTPVFNTPTAILTATIRSLQEQTYDRWELILADGGSTRPETRETLMHFGLSDSRVRVVFLEKNGGISNNSNACLEAARGDFVALLDHDDIIAPFALYEVARALNDRRDLDFLYSDKDMCSEDGATRFGPLFKPTWSPDQMLSANYLTHFCVTRTSLARELGGFRECTDGAQDWDYFLRVVERTANIAHIPKVLYHWRLWSSSVSSGIGAKPYALAAQLRSIEEHFARTGTKAKLELLPDTTIHLRRHPESKHSTTVVLATRGVRGAVPAWIERLETLRQSSRFHDDFELIVAHYGTVTQPVADYYASITTTPHVTIVTDPTLGRMALLNLAATKARGDLLLFLDEALTPQSDATLDDLIVWFDRPGVDAVGGRSISSAGKQVLGALAVAPNGRLESMFAGRELTAYGYNGHSLWYRNVSAISACCLAIRREVFGQLGGFRSGFDLAGGEYELCQSIVDRGSRLVFTPDAEFLLADDASLPINGTDADVITLSSRLSAAMRSVDPFLGPNLVMIDGWPTIGGRAARATVPQPKVDSRSRGVQLFDVRSASGVKFDPATAISYALAQCHDFEPEELEASQRLVNAFPQKIRVRTVNWFIPSFHNASYGGIHTILRLANHLQLTQGVENRFCIVGDLAPEKARAAIAKPFPGLARQPILSATTDLQVLDLPAADACVATFWTTAISLLKFNRTKRKFYMIQDCEPMFYSAGSTSGQVEATYRFGYHGLCNTESLRRIYETEYGGVATHLIPAVDPSIFYPRNFANVDKGDRPYRLFFYGRPNNPRNAFEMGMTAFRKLKARMGDRVEIYAAGEVWDPADFGLQGVVHNLGILSVEQTADLYRETDLGCVMMFTRHPSYLPFEFMACGCPVLTNINPATTWFLKDGVNCTLTEASASSLARNLERTLLDEDRRWKIARHAAEQIALQHSNWRGELDHIYEFMCDTSARRPLDTETSPVATFNRHVA
jgi:cellulose synthase/poly-beta-1,6-N-acetylglucosamine synthase-like glycosyltransferase